MRFGPLGNSQILAVSDTAARAAIGMLPANAPAIAITGLNAQTEALYVKLGDITVVAGNLGSLRQRPGSPDDPLILPVSAGETHVSILAEGAPGDVVITPGAFVTGNFAAIQNGSTIAVTQTDQRFALPTLGATMPAISLASMNAQMGPCWIKLGNSGVTGSITTSMRIQPGSPEDATIIQITGGETHLSIFCEGSPGDVQMIAGNLIQGNANTLNGLSTNSASGNRWGIIPVVGQADGGMEIGDFIDFHNSDGDTSDFSQRLDSFSLTNTMQHIAAGQIPRALAGIPTNALASGQIPVWRNSAQIFDALAQGNSGEFLKSLGAGATPAFAPIKQGQTVIATGSFPAAAQLDITNIPTDIAYLGLFINGASSTSAFNFQVFFSTNNGASFDATPANYPLYLFDAPSGTFSLNTGSSAIGNCGQTAAQSVTGYLQIFNTPAGIFPATMGFLRGGGSTSMASIGQWVSGGPINAIRLKPSAGNFDAGSYALVAFS